MDELKHATKRDRCWHALLIALFRHDEFALRQIYETEFDDDEINYATFRRTARALEELGFLSRRSEDAQRWSRGPKAELMMAKQQLSPENVFIEYNVDEIMDDPYLKELAMTAGTPKVEAKVREHLIDIEEDESNEES